MDIASLLPSFGNLLYTVGAFVVALSIIVAVHEYGHYIVGRWSGIRAEVFSLGFGPVLFSRKDRHGTRWQVAALPFGGYVKFLGDANAASAGPDDAAMARLSAEERRHTMHGAPLWARAATVAAGPVFNFVLSALIFATVFMTVGFATDTPTVGRLLPLPGGTGELAAGDTIRAVEGRAVPDYTTLQEVGEDLADRDRLAYSVTRDGAELALTGPAVSPPRIVSVAPESAAAAAGLAKGDVILSAEGRPVRSFRELQGIVTEAGGEEIGLQVWRPSETGGGSTFDTRLSARRTDLPLREGGFETRWLIGVGGGMFFEPVTRTVGPGEALVEGAREVGFVIRSSLSAFRHMLTGAISSCNLRGPIGIAETSGAAASAGLSDFFWFVAVLSTAVGLMNLLPIPVLDGGHLMFHAWEWASGRPPSDRLTGVLMTMGLAIVLALMLFGLTNDLRC
ncbi:RIP metalloprotease RseP [Frigidibacter oleivorans]|uniref:RIP metalloprotease RseP n=1 Tax=Frigidibacter oleivorans TaxID=2487129 RepID=UPI000F8D2AA1|nr:RIP metalloprotease RseP [Frigidibacter oleivorans]